MFLTPYLVDPKYISRRRLDLLNREGDNIGSWDGEKYQKVAFLYEVAEKCRAEAYKHYKNNNLAGSYVMFLRFAKFFDLIKTHPDVQTTSAAHRKCKLDLLNALTPMEEIKAKLLLQYGA